MNLFEAYKQRNGEVTKYTSGRGLLAKVTSKDGKHSVSFVLHGHEQKHSTVDFDTAEEAHDFAGDEVELHRTKELNKETNEEVVTELTVTTLKAYREKLKSSDAPKSLHTAATRFVGKRRADDKIHSIDVTMLRKKIGLSERIDMPQGHKESPDPISNDSEDQGRKKKMMGNRTPLEIIAKLLAGK